MVSIRDRVHLDNCPDTRQLGWLKSNVSEFVKLCTDYISIIWSQWSIVPVIQEKLIQTEKGTRGKKNFYGELYGPLEND